MEVDGGSGVEGEAGVDADADAVARGGGDREIAIPG